MLSKEEIEKTLNEAQKILAVANLSREDNTLAKLVVNLQHTINYIEQLETEKQKLIEKLEKDKVKYNEFEFMPLQIEKAYNNYYKLGKIDLADEILKILKGENNRRITYKNGLEKIEFCIRDK